MKQNEPTGLSWDHFTQLLAQNREIAGLYSAAFILITLVIGYIPITAQYFKLAAGPLLLLQLCAHLATGFWNISVLKKKLSFLDPQLHDGFLYTLFLSATASLALLVLYISTGMPRLIIAAAAGSCFLLPFLIRQTIIFYTAIPAPHYKIWINPSSPATTNNQVIPIRVPIRFKIAVNYFDMNEQVFPMAVSEKIKLGKVFHQFVTETNTKPTDTIIECEDNTHTPYGWQFYTLQWGGLYKNFLDPDLSLGQNKIKSDTVIQVTRVKTPQN